MPSDRRETLLALYPRIFCDAVDGTLQPRCAIACGDGWYRLIERLCACVQSLADHRHLPQPRAVQVKEKLGGLRFYWADGGDERVAAMTHYAESLSLHVCEVCGAPGALVREDCLRTRCDLHRDARA